MVTPNSWDSRTEMKVNVGVGTGSTQERITSTMSIMELQEKVLPYGLTTPDRVYNAIEDLVQALGKPGAAKYFLDPSTDEYKQLQQQKQQGQQAMQEKEEMAQGAIIQQGEKKIINDGQEIERKVQADLAKDQREYAKMELDNQVDIAGVGIEAEKVKKMSTGAGSNGAA